jgi:hypothetical protein
MKHTAKVSKRQPSDLPVQGSPEFKARCAKAWDQVIAKYAWTAQQGGVVLRKNPLKLPPYKDYVFNRMMKVDHGFKYRTTAGQIKVWYPKLDEIFSRYLDDGDHDVPFTMAERIEFIPGEPEISEDDDGCRVLNLWRPPPWQLQDDNSEPTPFLDHVSYLLDDDQAAVAHVLDFIAHLVQRPRERVGHALLITSEAKGIGKSTLGTVVRRLVGEQNSRVTQTKDLKAQFDGWLVGKLVVQVDEVYEAGNWALTDKLKPIITEPKVSVNIKYGPQLEIDNYARLILFSNHTAPINIEEGDRRYFVFNSKAQPKDDDYYEALYRYIDADEGMNAIYSFFRSRELSNFNPYRRPPMTQRRRK